MKTNDTHEMEFDPVDYEDLLKRYMAYIKDLCGTCYVDELAQDWRDTLASEEQLIALADLEDTQP
jgi:hypothetical protein